MLYIIFILIALVAIKRICGPKFLGLILFILGVLLVTSAFLLGIILIVVGIIIIFVS